MVASSRFVIFTAGAVRTPGGRWVARTVPALERLHDMGYVTVLHSPQYDERLAARGRQCFSVGVCRSVDFIDPSDAVYVVGEPGELARLPPTLAARFGLLEPTKALRLHRGRGQAERARHDLVDAMRAFEAWKAVPVESTSDLPRLVDRVWR